MAGDAFKETRAGFGDDALGGRSAADSAANPMTWRNADLRLDFNVPDLVAPVRLPDDASLAAQAGAAPLLGDLRGLARDVRDSSVPAADVDPLLLGLAVEAGLVSRDGDALVPGNRAARLDALVGDAVAGSAAVSSAAREATVLNVWDAIFALVLDTTLEIADETGPRVGAELDLAGCGVTLMLDLFLDGRAGLPVTMLSESVKQLAVVRVPRDDAEHQWREWVDAHGDPADLLLRQLAKLSAAVVDGEAARLEPLALRAVAARLRTCGVDVPELPPTAEMTPDDVVQLSLLGDAEDFAAEFASWTAERTPEGAARDLLAYAVDGGATVRPATVQVVSRLGVAAEPAWRDALDRPELRSYAKTALLNILADRDPTLTVPPELKLSTDDLAWLITDSFAPLPSLIRASTTFPFDATELADSSMNVSQDALFDAMARLDHPDAEAVLTMIGRHCNDKKTAKSARKAAFKAASRQGSRRSVDRPH
jgi:hypothetical protein